MNFNKSILYLFLILCSFAANIDARSFEVFVKKQGMYTLDNEPITELFPYKIIDIEGQYPDAVDNPTYGQIREKIAQAFNLDPQWRNFTVKYLNKKTGNEYFLKPYIQNLSRRERAVFFDKISQNGPGSLNMPMIIVAKREPSEMQQPQQTGILTEEFKTQEYGIRVPEEKMEILPYIEPRTTLKPYPTITREEPGWVFEESLVGEHDPYLAEQLKAAKQQYE